MLTVSQTRAAGTHVSDLGNKTFCSTSLPCGEKLQSSTLWENNKDKVLMDMSMLKITDSDIATISHHSDFLTITRNRIYKAQNDP